MRARRDAGACLRLAPMAREARARHPLVMTARPVPAPSSERPLWQLLAGLAAVGLATAIVSTYLLFAFRPDLGTGGRSIAPAPVAAIARGGTLVSAS
jgi:hypothetical protein